MVLILYSQCGTILHTCRNTPYCFPSSCRQPTVTVFITNFNLWNSDRHCFVTGKALISPFSRQFDHHVSPELLLIKDNRGLIFKARHVNVATAQATICCTCLFGSDHYLHLDVTFFTTKKLCNNFEGVINSGCVGIYVYTDQTVLNHLYFVAYVSWSSKLIHTPSSILH